MMNFERAETALHTILFAGLVLCFLSGPGSVHAQAVLQSGPEQVPMVELYTSQGCSSCPPADHWMSRLKQDSGLWERVVPLAFHVDYWDYIGWRDPFAQPEFGQRQRRYAAEGGARTVYTPGMILNGKDWRGWTRDALPHPKPARTGMLSLERTGQQVKVGYQPVKVTTRKLLVNVAWLGFDRVSDVTAGENRGRKLSNDFIVLEMIQAPLQRKGVAYAASLRIIRPQQDYSRLALAAWVADSSKQAPLQAVGGWWDEEKSQ